MRFPFHVFRAYDIRGRYKEEITEEFAHKLGKAVGTLIRKKKICVGYDTRPSSPLLAENLIRGLASSGCEVISLGMLPGPVACFLGWKEKIYSCYVTASHNPVDWNGFKLYGPDGVSFINELKKIKQLFKEGNFAVGKGKREERKDAIEEYTKFLTNQFGKLDAKVVVDCLGGAGVAAIKSLEQLGLQVVALHEKPDPTLYGFHRLEPWGKLLREVRKKVVEEKADFGVAWDCDADRSLFIDGRGKVVDPSVMNAIFIKWLGEKTKRPKVVITYDCASELKEVTKELSGELIWCRIGHGFIEKKLKEEEGLFGGEESSHFYLNIYYPFSDGILSTACLAKILQERGISLEKLRKEIRFNPIARIYISAGDDRIKEKVLRNLKKKIRGISIGDGVKMLLNEGEWVLIRKSQTLPEVNLCVQARSKKKLYLLLEKYSQLINREIERVKKLSE